MTLLEVVNKVLVRMRESTVSSFDETDYSAMITEFVRQALSTVEDAYDWNALRTTVIVPTTSGIYAYSLTNVGTSFKLLYIHENTLDYDLMRAPSARWVTHALLSDMYSAGAPLYYDINGVTASGAPVINLVPIPDGVYSLDVALKVKTVESADETTVVLVPWLPVVLKAYELAVDERGDDQGDTLAAIRSNYEEALGAGVSYDAALNTEDTTWYEE